MKKLYLLMLSMLLTISLSAASNFVSNGTFEDGTDGWTLFENEGTSSFDIDTTSPIVGAKSGLITILTSTSSGVIEDSWKQGLRWRMSTFKDARYKVHFKARASQEVQLVTEFQQKFSPFDGFGETEWTITTQNQDFDIIVNNNKGVGGDWAFNIYFGHISAGTKIWIDDVKIEEVANETTGKLTDGNMCNGDFEADVPNSGADLIAGGWRTYYTDPAKMTFAIDNTTPISGKRSFKGTCITPGSAGWNTQIIWNFCPVVGLKYSIEFKAKATANVPIVVEAIDDWPERPNSVAYLNFDVTTSVNTFKADCPNVVTEYDLYTYIFWLGNLPANNSIWLDDIKIFQTDLSSGIQKPYVDDVNTSIKAAGDNIIINCSKTASINIYDMQGKRVVKQNAVVGENIIRYEKGIYVVQVIDSDSVIKSTKVILK